MRIINEELEKRNLGVDTVSITIEHDDNISDIENTLKDAEGQYIVLKIPTIMTDATYLASKYGFSYVEDMMFFEHDLHEIVRTPLQQRLYDAVTISEMTDKDFKLLHEEIEKGSFSFVTRNYYVHPFISDLCIILVSEIIWRSEQCVRYIRNAKMYLQTSLIS